MRRVEVELTQEMELDFLPERPSMTSNFQSNLFLKVIFTTNEIAIFFVSFLQVLSCVASFIDSGLIFFCIFHEKEDKEK